MTYRWIEHTGEVELEIEAADEREVFAESLAALRELLAGDAPQAGALGRTISIAASDRPALLVGWLEELLFLAESRGFVANSITRLELGANGLEGDVDGVIDAPRPFVKAVTYSDLLFESRGAGYLARVVLDV